ncbi:hypothetical protein ULG90_06400 [Halopseudomonas pachastrellae]|nr:hypothetical protein ULG90_06400 [Halopseudomonas pachastrellae]
MTDVELKLTANTSAAERGIAGFSKSMRPWCAKLSKPLGRVNAFRDLESALEESGRQAARARERVRELGDELGRTDTPTKQLTASYRDAVRELQGLERQEKAQTVQLARMREELKGAGVDTKNLASEQSRLQRELATQMGRSDRAGPWRLHARTLGWQPTVRRRQRLAPAARSTAVAKHGQADGRRAGNCRRDDDQRPGSG